MAGDAVAQLGGVQVALEGVGADRVDGVIRHQFLNLAAVQVNVGVRGGEMVVHGNHVPGLHEGAGDDVFTSAALVGGKQVFLAEDVPYGLLQAVKALGTGIGVVRTEHGGDLVVAHGVDAGIRQHVQVNVVRAKLERVEPGFLRGFQTAFHGDKMQLLHHADFMQFQGNLFPIVKFDNVGWF